ncbi:MAG: DUF4258 domain-containing protein [Chloroflexota bacterium]
MSDYRFIFHVHAIQRMFERCISVKDVRHILATGETIENYPDDLPYTNRLILGWRGNRPIHVVAAENAQDNEVIVITVYQPDTDQWTADFRERRP